MSSTKELRSGMALMALESIPPSLRRTVASDVRMQDNYDLRVDTVLEVGASDLSAQVSAIARGVREALDGAPSATLQDTNGNAWSVELDTDGIQPTLFLVRGERRVGMHPWLTLSPDRDTRLRCLEALADDAGLPPKASSFWRQVLEERSLGSTDVAEFAQDLHDTAKVQEQFLAASVRPPGLDLPLAAAPSRRYFERLIGACGASESIQQHAAGGARERLVELAAWRPYRGFLQSLYMASHTKISEQIRADALSSEELVRAFEFLLRDGDAVSQLGAIEVGLRSAADRPELHTLLSELVERMRADDPTGEESRFREFSTLYILVSNELSRRRQLAGVPPFYRRLAALAQAGVIQRQIVAAGVGLKGAALDSVAGEYLARSLVDLRLEPRRHPTLALPERLQAHFLRRVAKAASQCESDLGTKLFRELGYLLGPEGLRQAGEAFVLYTPGPLEEAEESRQLPAEFAQAVRAQIGTDGTVAPVDFAALRTSAASFHVDETHADLAATAFTRSDYRLENVESRAELVDTLSSLAAVAAVARSKPLADALRVVVRSYRQDAELPVALLEAAQILLVAAASRADLDDWANFVGECLTGFAFGELADDDGQVLHDFVRRLCELAPELWATCGRADAALMAFNGSRPRAPTGAVSNSRS